MVNTKEKKALRSYFYNEKKPIDSVDTKSLKGLVTYYRNKTEEMLLEVSFLKRTIEFQKAKLSILQKGKRNNNYHNFKNLKVKNTPIIDEESKN